MKLLNAMQQRHSVRAYQDIPIPEEIVCRLKQEICRIEGESGLQIALCTNEPEAFSGALAHYGRFRNCKNYLAIAAENGEEETVGWYGEELVLLAQSMGLNSCWVALTFRKGKVPFTPVPGKKLAIVISLGYGQTQGRPHKSKPIEKLCRWEEPIPDWFRKGMEAALLAPKAINQQRFFFTQKGRRVSAKELTGPCSKIDLGIVKYHFTLGAGQENFDWE